MFTPQGRSRPDTRLDKKGDYPLFSMQDSAAKRCEGISGSNDPKNDSLSNIAMQNIQIEPSRSSCLCQLTKSLDSSLLFSSPSTAYFFPGRHKNKDPFAIIRIPVTASGGSDSPCHFPIVPTRQWLSYVCIAWLTMVVNTRLLILKRRPIPEQRAHIDFLALLGLELFKSSGFLPLNKSCQVLKENYENGRLWGRFLSLFSHPGKSIMTLCKPQNYDYDVTHGFFCVKWDWAKDLNHWKKSSCNFCTCTIHTVQQNAITGTLPDIYSILRISLPIAFSLGFEMSMSSIITKVFFDGYKMSNIMLQFKAFSDLRRAKARTN